MKMFIIRLAVSFFIIAVFNTFAIAAGDEQEPLQTEGVSTAAKYISIPTNLDAAAEVTLANAFMNRGQLNDNNPVVQPQVQLAKYGFYLNFWGNLGLTDQVTDRREFSEVDITLGYQPPIKPLNIRVGLIDYIYPNVNKHETHEVFLTFEYPHAILTPRFEAYYDFDEANGAYLFFALEHKFLLRANKLRLTPGLSSAWGSCPYNNFFFSTNKSALNDGNAYAELDYDLTKDLTVGISMAYTWLWDSAIREGADTMYYGDNQMVFAVKLLYDL